MSAILDHELKHQAARCMRGERPGITLQATALVHETFLRLTGAGQVAWQDRKRIPRLPLARCDESSWMWCEPKRPPNAVHERSLCYWTRIWSLRVPQSCISLRLTKPWRLSRRSMLGKVRVIELRFFAGLTVEETAEVLDVAPDTVARDWRLARTWLLQQLDPRLEP